MKKIFTFLVILLICSNILFAQHKVAVYVTGGTESGINKVLGDKLVEAFVKSGKYSAIERTSSFLSELNKELKYQQTGHVSDAELSQLGKQFGVQLICIADISDVFGEKYVSARLIDVESAEVINSSNTSGSLNSLNDLIKVSEKIAKDLSGKTGKEQVAESERLKSEQEQRNLQEQRAEQERRLQLQIQEERIRQAEKERKEKEERDKALQDIGNTIGTLIAGNGTIRLNNKDKDPFYVYIDGEYVTTISGYSTLELTVPSGKHYVRVLEKSGYIITQQEEKWTVNVEKNKTVTCTWD